MRVSFMQQVDYWVGVPLCLLFSAAHRAISPFRGSLPKPKRILFIELSEMGSAIIAHSSLVRARDKHGGEIYFLIFERNKESVSLLETIPQERILSVRDENFVAFFFSMLTVLIKLWRLRIDTAIDLELFSRCTALITILCGARNRVGFDRFTNEGLYRGSFLTHRVLYNPHQHMSLNFLSLVEALEDDRDELPMLKRNVAADLVPLPRLRVSDAEKSAIRALLGPEGRDDTELVVFNPDPGLLPLRGWPLDRFVDLAARVAREHPRVSIVVIGLARSREYADAIRAEIPADRFVDLTGKTSTIREVVALLSISRLLVTNDSGPAHIASLTDVRSIVLFGPETPRLYGPLGERATSLFAGLACSPCYAASNHRRTVCTNNRCLQAIGLDEVSAAVNRHLSEGSAGSRSGAPVLA